MVGVSPLATWFRPGEIGFMGRPFTHESLGGKQGKPGGLVVQTPGAKCGDHGQVKRALRIGVTEGSRHVCPGKLNHPPLPSGDRRQMWDIRVDGTSADRIPDVRYPGGWNVGQTSADVRHPDKGGTSAGQNSGCEISEYIRRRWNVGWTEFRMWDIRVEWVKISVRV